MKQFWLPIAILLFISYFHFSSAQFNPVCRGKRYMCDTNKTIPEPDICMYVNDTKNKLHFIQPCTDPEFPVCDFSSVSFDTPARCVAASEVKLTLPGETCTDNENCYSGKCESRICQGAAEGAICEVDEDCGIGLFCSDDLKCEKQQLFGQNCTRDHQCTNNCACNMNKCVYYYSFDNDLEADNPMACASGYIEEGFCKKALISQYKGRPCTTSDDCMAYDQNEQLVQYGECQCGYNGGGFTYCTLAEGDDEFKQMKNKFEFIVARGYYCHTKLRFGPCNQLYEDEYIEYEVAVRYFKEYPQLVFNDVCIKEAINTEFWQFAGAERFVISSAVFVLALFTFFA